MKNFSKAILAEQPDANNWTISDEEVQKRRDLRSNLIFSIDPQGCEDVDDALSVRYIYYNSATYYFNVLYRQLKNGGYEMGVHIADVSYFVSPSSNTDEEARVRYLTQLTLCVCVI